MTPAAIRRLAKDLDFAIDVTEPREVILQRFEDILTEALTDLAQERTPQWQPIESAPKDGTRILGVNEEFGTVRVTWWDEAHQSFASFALGLTHWMPLPPSPVSPAPNGT